MSDRSVRFVVLNSSPLLKGSSNTNFVFLVERDDNLKNLTSENFTSTEIEAQILAQGGKLNFETIQSNMFFNNLIMVDGYMPKIVSELILCSLKTKAVRLNFITKQLELEDPLKYGNGHDVRFYIYKIKELIRHLALGMNSYKLWSGKELIVDHYPVIKEADHTFYYVQDIARFCQVLLDNCYLRFPSTYFSCYGDNVYLNVELEITININSI